MGNDECEFCSLPSGYREGGSNLCRRHLGERYVHAGHPNHMEINRARQRYLVYLGKVTPVHSDELTSPPKSMAEADRWLAEHAR